MEESLTIFVMGAMLFGFYYGYIIGKNIDQKFSNRKWISKIMNSFFVITFTLLAFTNIQIFASANESQFEFFIPRDFDSAVYLIVDWLILSKGTAGILHLFSMIIILPIIWLIRGADKEAIKNISVISGGFLMLVTLIPFVPGENMSVLFAAFQFLSIVGVFVGINREDRHSLKQLIRFMLGESAASK